MGRARYKIALSICNYLQINVFYKKLLISVFGLTNIYIIIW